MLNASAGVGRRQSVYPPRASVEAPATALSQVISPLSTFCHMRPVTLSVTVPLPLSVKLGALMR